MERSIDSLDKPNQKTHLLTTSVSYVQKKVGSSRVETNKTQNKATFPKKLESTSSGNSHFCFVLSVEQDYQKLEQEKDYKNDLLPMKTLDVESDLRYLSFFNGTAPLGGAMLSMPLAQTSAEWLKVNTEVMRRYMASSRSKGRFVAKKMMPSYP